MSKRLKRFLSATLALVAPAFFQPAAADPVEDFYKGKSLEMVVPTSPGGDYDSRGRLVARRVGH